MDYTAIILAGGKSSRFGSDKTKLKINGELIIQSIVNKCKKKFSEIIIVSNQQNKFNIPGVKEVSDSYLGYGPLGGIHAGLSAATSQVCFVSACDMPLFHLPLVEYILSKSQGYDIAVPRESNGNLQPLFAAYTKNTLHQIESLLLENKNSILNLYKITNVFYIDESDWKKKIRENEDVFYNINYGADYERFVSENE